MMKVVVRIRPLSQREHEKGAKACCEAIKDSQVVIRKAGSKSAYLKSQTSDLVTDFAFDRVFGASSSQDDVYQETIQPYLRCFLSGQNITVLAYGATGAGKTHTMFGSDIAKISKGETGPLEAYDGLIPRSLQEICAEVAKERQNALFGEAWSTSMSFFEVYNDQVYDLVEPKDRPLAVREDAERGVVQVVGLKETAVRSASEMFALLAKGQALRKTEPTQANVVSSRSHAVLQITLQHITRNSTGSEVLVESKLSFVDLAGSERGSATNNRGVRLQEGANINRSLLALANCITSLAEKNSNPTSKKTSVLKYRDSKLTHILKTSLEGNCNLVMIANVSPSNKTFEDSLHTLQYANRAKNIKVNPTIREQVLESTSLEREARLREDNDLLRMTVQILQEQNELLKAENAQLKEDLALATRESVPRRFTFGFGRSSHRRSSTAHELPPEKKEAAPPRKSFFSFGRPSRAPRPSITPPASPPALTSSLKAPLTPPTPESCETADDNDDNLPHHIEAPDMNFEEDAEEEAEVDSQEEAEAETEAEAEEAEATHGKVDDKTNNIHMQEDHAITEEGMNNIDVFVNDLEDQGVEDIDMFDEELFQERTPSVTIRKASTHSRHSAHHQRKSLQTKPAMITNHHSPSPWWPSFFRCGGNEAVQDHTHPPQ